MKEKIKELLISTSRDGMPGLVVALETWGFFESPASTRFHGSHEGGLMDHSYLVFKKFLSQLQALGLIDKEIQVDSVIICSLLHDTCKAGLYIPEEIGRASCRERV